MSDSIKHLREKYFVKEDDGYHINKKAALDSAEAAMFTGGLIAFAIIGGLAAIGLATIGAQTIHLGAKTVKHGAVLIVDKLK